MTQDQTAGRIDRREYDALPESIKSIYTLTQWLWLGEERSRAIERETQPDMDYTE